MSTAGKKVKDEEIKQYMAEAEHPGLGTGATMASIVETLGALLLSCYYR